MTVLDGNVIGGAMHEVFNAEMTAVTGTCAACGATAPLAETLVYLDGPGIVVRCRGCTAILMVITKVRQYNCVDLRGLAALD